MARRATEPGGDLAVATGRAPYRTRTVANAEMSSHARSVPPDAGIIHPARHGAAGTHHYSSLASTSPAPSTADHASWLSRLSSIQHQPFAIAGRWHEPFAVSRPSRACPSQARALGENAPCDIVTILGTASPLRTGRSRPSGIALGHVLHAEACRIRAHIRWTTSRP
jgi:hypothetical protein